MWADNETDRDFLNFSSTSDTIASIILQAKGRPISIGLSGQWGIGKSSMIKLLQKSIKEKNPTSPDQFVFVEFNAWLYQGFDDARAALMDVIAESLLKEANKRQKGVDKAKEFIKRIKWLRVVKLGLNFAPLFFGLPPIGLANETQEFIKGISSKGLSNVNQGDIDTASELAKKGSDQFSGLLKDKTEESPPKEIQALRDYFEQCLKEIDVTLVVLIDDLDRCLPGTTISTLEAIRLFLFLKNTAFVIAADDKMIKHAVKDHFKGIDDELVTNYFDKLIQIPIKVPALGVHEVRAYMMLLFTENSSLSDEQKESIRSSVCQQLSQSWKGKRVDHNFVKSLGITLPPDLSARYDTAERLATIMTTSTKINGNPRIVKRFLNALSIRMSLAQSLGIGVDEAVLAKLLLFERCGDQKGYFDIMRSVSEDLHGKPLFLKAFEDGNFEIDDKKLDASWKSDFVKEWIRIPPMLSDKDLRGALYAGKEQLPLVSSDSQLSSAGVEILDVLLTAPDMAASLKDQIKNHSKAELPIMMDKLLEKARQEQDWGTPDILEACLAIATIDEVSSAKLKNFFFTLPKAQIKPNIIPKLSDQPWSTELFEHWTKLQVTKPVLAAIRNLS